MNMKNIISLTEARKRLFEIVSEVVSPAVVYTLTERGTPKAVIMSATEYESWIETMEVLRDSPNILKSVKETRDAWKSGAWKKWPTLDELKKDFMLNDKPKKAYVRTGNKNLGKKRVR
ncbi:MAG: type II toxin-antitoxin system Phd/YefM family antitoxin [Candidatus Paceibacterota bacterium]|jgi:prevent-host-death family protein